MSTHYLMRPGDIVEPAPGSEALFLRNARRRLANNNFVFKKDGPPSAGRQLASRRSPLVSADFERIMADGEAVGESYRRLPPARTGGHAASASDQGGGGDDDAVATGKSGWPAARQAQLDAIVPSLVCALAGKGSAIEGEMAKRRGEVSVLAPPSPPAATKPPPATLAWQAPGAASAGETPKALLHLDRTRLRKLMLGLLALRPLGGKEGKDTPF